MISLQLRFSYVLHEVHATLVPTHTEKREVVDDQSVCLSVLFERIRCSNSFY